MSSRDQALSIALGVSKAIRRKKMAKGDEENEKLHPELEPKSVKELPSKIRDLLMKSQGGMIADPKEFAKTIQQSKEHFTNDDVGSENIVPEEDEQSEDKFTYPHDEEMTEQDVIARRKALIKKLLS